MKVNGARGKLVICNRLRVMRANVTRYLQSLELLLNEGFRSRLCGNVRMRTMK